MDRLNQDLISAVNSLRAVLAAINRGELCCSTAARDDLECAMVALEGLARSVGTELEGPVG
ncbi:MAG TPA: hypothetical protein VE673_15665 [Pseudonocardiaceae bacterium]|jgi:hypothetical protein|nr:hypothetical protein [Pseudonocardiaceae bacterium]